MPETIRLLHLEDVAREAELIWRELSRAGLAFEPVRVEEEDTFLDKLVSFRPDIVLSDYSLPHFNGVRALELVSEHAPDVPVIIVTGSQNEETAVSCMRAGAVDYVIKEHLARLPAAVNSALHHRRVETLRREAEQRFALFMRFLPARAYILDGEGRYIFANEKVEELFGTPAAHIIGKSLRDFVGVQSAREAEEHNALVLSTGVAQLFEETIVVAGEERTYLSSKFPVVLDDGKLLLGGASVDITERKRAAEAVKKSELEFRSLAENLPDLIVRFDRQRRRTFVNRRVETTTGLPRDVFLGKTSAELPLPPELTEAWERAIDRTFDTNEVSQFEFALDTPTGLRQFEASIVPETVGGQVQTALAVAHDVTERKRNEAALRESEQQLVQAQKMEAVGRLAGGIAHDFNNVLMAILLQGKILQRLSGGNEEMVRRVDEILKAGQRASTLTRQLMAFSRNDPVNPQVLSLQVVIHNLRDMLQRMVTEDVSLVFELDQPCLPVRGDPGRFEQVVMNLVINARDAMPRGGTILIRVRNATDVEMDSAGCLSGMSYVLLSVTDEGIGMDSATVQRIFEPFFTTKPKDKGTGLGLSVVYGIVTDVGGLIRVTSEPGSGSTFNVFVPATGTAAEQPAEAGASAAEEELNGTETILLVEDDSLVRNLLSSILRAKGYTVLEAGDSTEAFTIARKVPTIDLLLTDVVIPTINGVEVARTLAAGRPGMHVILMSGYAEDALAPYGLDASDAVLLRKPFTETRLLSAVRGVLGPPR